LREVGTPRRLAAPARARRGHPPGSPHPGPAGRLGTPKPWSKWKSLSLAPVALERCLISSLATTENQQLRKMLRAVPQTTLCETGLQDLRRYERLLKTAAPTRKKQVTQRPARRWTIRSKMTPRCCSLVMKPQTVSTALYLTALLVTELACPGAALTPYTEDRMRLTNILTTCQIHAHPRFRLQGSVERVLPRTF
jgi:hypothetical protein